MPRTIYLVTYSQAQEILKHWALFVPNIGSADTGKLIEVEGSPETGFLTQFRRNYSFAFSHRKWQLYPLSNQVHDQAVKDIGGPYFIDASPVDYLESVAYGVRPPGPAPRRASHAGRNSMQNCQTWIRQVIVALVDAGVLSSTAIAVADGAPH